MLTIIVGPCAEADAMSPESNNPVSASSNNEDVNNMKEEGDDRWVSDNTDYSPTVNITVADNDSFIKYVTVQNTTNVQSITITVYNEEGTQVQFYSLYLLQMIQTFHDITHLLHYMYFCKDILWYNSFLYCPFSI